MNANQQTQGLRADSYLSDNDQSAYGVNRYDLKLLNDTIDQWAKFLSEIFIVASKDSLVGENISEVAAMDNNLYLDIEIQLTQCIGSTQNENLTREFENICKEVRKISYHFINTTLNLLKQSSKQLLEEESCAQMVTAENAQTIFLGSKTEDFDAIVGHHDDIVDKHKKALQDLKRQHRDTMMLFVKLKRFTKNRLYADELLD